MTRPMRKGLYLAARSQVYRRLHAAGIWIDPATSLDLLAKIVDGIERRRPGAWRLFQNEDPDIITIVAGEILARVEGCPTDARAERGAP